MEGKDNILTYVYTNGFFSGRKAVPQAIFVLNRLLGPSPGKVTKWVEDVSLFLDFKVGV